MLKTLRKKRAQGLVEYVILVTIVIGAFIAIGTYLKRGVQGRWKDAIDDMGEQYDPRFGDVDIRHSIQSNTITQIVTVNTTTGLFTSRSDDTISIETKTGTKKMGAQ